MNFINKLRVGSDLTKLTEETALLVKRDAHGLPLSLPNNCYEGQSDNYLEKLEGRLKRLSLMHPVDVTRQLLKNQIVARRFGRTGRAITIDLLIERLSIAGVAMPTWPFWLEN